MKNSFNWTFLQERKLLQLTQIFEKSKKMVVNGRVLNRLVYDLDNGFH